MGRSKHVLTLLGAFCILVCSLFFVGLTVRGQGAAISRGFTTQDTKVVNAGLVSTVDDEAGEVELADSESRSRLAGIVSSVALVNLQSEETADVRVVLSGTAEALVSDINGEIRAGDKITVSPIRGVGMLATSDGQVAGTALASFDAESAEEQTVTTRTGESRTVHIGSIPIEVGVAYYAAPTSQFVPPFFQNLANTIAGRPVSFARILLSLILLVLAFLSIGVLIFTSVRAGIISLGRNPLAASAIHRGLLGIAFITLMIIAFTLIAVYLILIY